MTNSHLNLKLTGNRSQCGACREYFNSVGAFDKHRVGTPADRSCASPSDIGMSFNAAGYWITKERAV